MDPKQVEVLDQAEHEPRRWQAWKRWLCTLLVIGAGCGCVVGYLFVKNIAIPTYQHAKRFERAEAMFKERCKRSGVFIHRTVQDVEEILLINVRETGQLADGQFSLSDPYGDDYGGEAYIASFLEHPERARRGDATARATRYRAVHAQYPEPGRYRRFRYVPLSQALKEIPAYRAPRPSELLDHRPYLMSGADTDQAQPRYGLRFRDISTREERNYWIAGSSLQVVDMYTGEVIAERVGYLWDPGQGERSGGRSPWMVAARAACPEFRPLPGMDSNATAEIVQLGQAFRFVRQVLIPTSVKGN